MVKVITQKSLDLTVATEMMDVLKKTARVDIIKYPGMLSGIGIKGFRPQFSEVIQYT
ncbi:MAG: hypothetical protein KTR26_07825 [Flammeovirgaceae bacterium]|nr:hypothetical protein [Flammeovirgaceae bacterium]